MRAEDTYLHRIRRFIFFHCKKRRREMYGPQVEALLSHFATFDGNGARDRVTMLPARISS